MLLTFIKKQAIPDSLKTNSLFANHVLQTKSIEYKFHYTHYDYLAASILFFSFVLFVWIYISNHKHLNQVVNGFYINRYANQLARDEFSFFNRVTFILSLLFVLTLSLFISQTLTYFGFGSMSLNFMKLFGFTTLTVIGTYFIKLTTVGFSGYLFQNSKATSDYIMTIFLFSNTLGLFLLPIVICLAFVRNVSPLVFIYSGIFVVVAFLFIRFVRGLNIWRSGLKASPFYLFVYLCTQEILPLFILIKLATLLTK